MGSILSQKNGHLTINKQRKKVKQFVNLESLPKDIVDIINMYYVCNYEAMFNKQDHGNFIEFINDKKIRKYDLDTNKTDFHKHGCSTCLCDIVVTDAVCTRFEIDFKLIINNKLNDLSIFIGYVTSYDCIKDWSCGLGEGRNGAIDGCVGIYINWREKMTLRSYKSGGGFPKFPKGTHFRNGDIFTLSFNFAEDNIKIYVNHKYGDTISLKGHKSIIAGVSIWELGDSIEIVGHRYY